jgi:hypothetical protein
LIASKKPVSNSRVQRGIYQVAYCWISHSGAQPGPFCLMALSSLGPQSPLLTACVWRERGRGLFGKICIGQPWKSLSMSSPLISWPKLSHVALPATKALGKCSPTGYLGQKGNKLEQGPNHTKFEWVYYPSLNGWNEAMIYQGSRELMAIIEL